MSKKLFIKSLKEVLKQKKAILDKPANFDGMMKIMELNIIWNKLVEDYSNYENE
jgi:hypothetical protein